MREALKYIFNKIQTLFGSIKYRKHLKESLIPQSMKEIGVT